MFREEPVRMLPRWLVVMAICLTVGQGLAPAKPAKPLRGAALVGMVGRVPGRNAVLMVGGYLPGQGWVDGVDAKGAMHKGDQLPLYMLRRGRVGSALLTDDGFNLSSWDSRGSNHESWNGLGYHARFRLARAKSQVEAGEPACAIWHAPGTPEPRWLPAKVLDPKSKTYREVLADWLRQRGVSEQPERGLTVWQIVRADANADGREEVFLSFGWSERTPSQPLSPVIRDGLLMRYLPPGSDRPRVVVVLDKPDLVCTVAGLCDLDRDGWAEVLVEHAGQECGGMCLCHWTGQGFEHVSGYSGGE